MERLLTLFPAFKHRNYQLYFGSQLVSLIGTWLQQVAQGWLVLQLTHSAFWVGVITALGTLPVFFFVLFGGVVVDRFSTKKVIFFTQIISVFVTGMMGILTVMHVITVWQIALLAFMLGLVNAIDMPARQAFGVELVGKEDLHSAIALNSGMFNSARAIGPAVAGLLIALIGTGGVFLINAVSFIPVIIALGFIRPLMNHMDKQTHPLRAVQQGVRYAVSHEVINRLLFLTILVSVFGWSYVTILPVVVQDVFHRDAAWLGYCFTAVGIGALIGSIFVSIYAKRIAPVFLIVSGISLFALGLLLFSYMPNLSSGLPFLLVAGFGSISAFSTVNTSIQHLVPDAIRGRVLSVYTFCFLGLAPLGSLQVGWIAEHFGSLMALRINAMMVLLAGLSFYFLSKRIATVLGNPDVKQLKH